MIPTKEKEDVQVVGSFGAHETYDIEVNAAAFAVLSKDIYTDNIRAVIREYSCNALDAHKDAGNPNKFDVILPTRFEPTFIVRDYGTGLSHEDAMTIFKKYFSSTKRDSNTQIGMLGLGSKSGFAISRSFDVVSYHNGTERVYSSYQDEEDIPHFVLLSEQDTDEPNGLKISVPVKSHDVSAFVNKAIQVFRVFDDKDLPNIKQEVLDGVAKYKKSCVLSQPDYMILEGESWNAKQSVLMGNVEYAVKDLSFLPSELSYFQNMHIILKMPIGSCSFDAGRENIKHNSNATKQNIIEALRKVDKDLIATLESKIVGAKTFYEAMQIARKTKDLYKGDIDRLKWNGKKLQRTKFGDPPAFYYTSYSQTRNEMEYPDYDERTVYFWDKQGYSHRAKYYLSKPDNDYTKIAVIKPEHVDIVGIDKSIVRNLDDLEVPPKKHNTVSAYDPVKVFEWNGNTYTGKSTKYNNGARSNWSPATVNYKDPNELIYVEVSHFEPCGVYGMRDMGSIGRIIKDLEFIIGPINTLYGVKSAATQQKKFRESSFISLFDYIKREVDKAKFSTESRRTTENDSIMRSLVLSKTQDGLVKAIEPYFTDKDKSAKDLAATRLDTIGIDYTKSTLVDSTIKQILKKYPFLRYVDSSCPREELKKLVENYT